MGQVKDNKPYDRNIELYNTPLESGLRALVILSESKIEFFDLHRLIYFDYLTVHSADVDGPPSLHAATPHRSGEILIRRDLIQQGLELMYSRELVEKVFTSEGIFYKTTELTIPFIRHFSSRYFKDLQSRSKWVSDTYDSWAIDELRNLFDENIDRWGAEFRANKK